MFACSWQVPKIRPKSTPNGFQKRWKIVPARLRKRYTDSSSIFSHFGSDFASQDGSKIAEKCENFVTNCFCSPRTSPVASQIPPEAPWTSPGPSGSSPGRSPGAPSACPQLVFSSVLCKSFPELSIYRPHETKRIWTKSVGGDVAVGVLDIYIYICIYIYIYAK